MLRPLEWEGPIRTDLPSSADDGTVIGYPINPEFSPVFRQLVFLKYGVTFRELIRQIDMDKDERAHRKLMSIHRDYWKLLTGFPLKNFKLKFSWDHFGIMTHGFDFGLDKLTPDELAECLDEICPCEQWHSPEYLKKLRIRIKQASEMLIGDDK